MAIPANSSHPPRLAYSVDDAAQALGVGRSTLYGLIKEGKLASRKIGRRTVIPVAAVEALLAGDAQA